MGKQDTPGTIARGFAAVPLTPSAERSGDPSNPSPPVVVVAKVNRFAGVFPLVTYRAVPERKPTVFESGSEKGTKQYGLCDVVIENFGGIEGVTMPGYRIVKRISPDEKVVKVLCVPPQFSKGGPMKDPYINVKLAEQDVKDEYAAFLDTMIGGFYVWAKKRKSAGLPLYDGKATTGGAGTVTQDVSDENAALLSF